MTTAHNTNRAGSGTYAGLFLVTLATLMLEVMLTRIFSVTMWYHFAFLAISIAMFGMTAGAIFVYLSPRRFPVEATTSRMALFALLFAGSTVVSVVSLLAIPFIERASIAGISSIAATYLAASIPFFLSGVCVTLALTRFPRMVGKLYAADLLGAASGCLLLIWLLELTDGPNTVLCIAFLAGLGGVGFAFDAGARRLQTAASGLVLLLAVTVAANSLLLWQGLSPLRLSWVKGRQEQAVLYEEWNSHSRISVHGDPDVLIEPFGWGMSPVYVPRAETRQIRMNIDASASTELTGYDGNIDAVDYLRYDLSNLAHYVRSNAHVLVIGSGGGRDVLSALLFDQRKVTAVEINKGALRAANEVFGDFTGHLDRDPRVRFINDEARSYIARQQEAFDIIQISLIDTWAATAAGAFALTENTLYTIEAWEIFLSKLTGDGLLSVTRWFHDENRAEVYRLTALANAALRAAGVEEPLDHMILVRRTIDTPGPNRPRGVGTILVSPSPFTDVDLARIEQVVHELRFEIVLSPRGAIDATFRTLAMTDDPDGYARSFEFDISPPTDDSPFFFHVLRLRDFFRRDMWNRGGMSYNAKAIGVLGAVMLIVVTLTILCIVLPLLLAAQRPRLGEAAPLLLYFAAIGLGFMLVEISQMQRLIVVLGHPTYALSVVLFTLLVSSGIGSALTSRLPDESTRKGGLVLFTGLALLVVVLALLMPWIAATFQSSTTPVRIGVTVATIAPLGLLMGTAFPLGMRIASRRTADLTPWLWGINGAASVCASVLAIVISLSAGISFALWAGGAAYAVAAMSFVAATRSSSGR